MRRSVRTKLPIAATPLRQVMSKSIQRAIREHIGNSPRSPLDLRMSPVVRRTDSDRLSSPYRLRTARKEAQPADENRTPIGSSTRRRSSELRSASGLETVYETAQHADASENCDADDNVNRIESERKMPTSGPDVDREMKATPMASDRTDENESTNNEVWYTPCESAPSETQDVSAFNFPFSFSFFTFSTFLFAKIFTPVIRAQDRPALRPPTRISYEEQRDESAAVAESEQSNRSSTLWSIVSSVLRFASLAPFESKDKSSDDFNCPAESDPTSPFIIKRCASFAGNKHDHYPHHPAACTAFYLDILRGHLAQ